MPRVVRWLSTAAHPRSRGENLRLRHQALTSTGSSPLTRGKRLRAEPQQARLRLIPAHAGKTRNEGHRCRPCTAHPRSRGENHRESVSSANSEGSSPLTRGKRRGWARRRRSQRLIPAHAGKTLLARSPYRCPAAHPRSRGENTIERGRDAVDRGSSPLTRGKHFLTCVFIAQIGQILESLELCASSESYSSQDAYATGAPQDQVRSIGLVPRSSRDAS